ncbi:MAG: hypothetical protein H8E28_09560 [Anaerolineae bacterium]|nr:hypothetical protein [Anaerolineae bacterium]
MRTPAGKECPYFYGDYYRGRNREECRLLENWQSKLCNTCPVPGIHLANACQHMVLNATVVRPFFILPPEVQISAYCKKTEQAVAEPQIGCGKCHSLPEIFTGDSFDPNTHASD